MILMRLAALLVLLATAAAGCTSTDNTGQYQRPARGGWDNFRADAAPADRHTAERADRRQANRTA